MPKKASSADTTRLASWLKKNLARAAKHVNVVAVEWNEGWPIEADDEDPPSMMFNMCGLARDGDEAFDPEDPDHVDELSMPAWECDESCPLPVKLFDKVDAYDFVKGVLKDSKQLEPLLAKVDVAYGEHEGDLKLHRARRAQATTKSSGPAFYELHVEHKSNAITDHQIRNLDKWPMFHHDPLPGKLGKGVKFVLQKRPRLLDFLWCWDWLVCSERAMELLRTATKKIQVFPAPLWDGDRKIEGYFLVNLYEKLDCLRDEGVKPPRYKGAPKDFDQSKGYRVRLSVVKDRQVFRINYEQFRLLVSQEFRDKLEKAGITGLGWLRRQSAP